MTEEYISGYLDCVSRIKGIYTPYLGGFNCFFGVDKKGEANIQEELMEYLDSKKVYYDSRSIDLEALKNKIELVEIEKWPIKLIPMIEKWTCDKLIEKEKGKNGDYLSEYLVKLIADFLPKDNTKLYKINPDSMLWPWGDNISEEYLFETKDKFYILHFGESS